MIAGPWRITLDTNPGLCNFNCMMCEEHSNHSEIRPDRKRIMSIDTVRKAVDMFHGKGLREVIPSTMGEPLLYPYFDELLDIIHRKDIGLNLTTNGSFPGRSTSDWAEAIMPLATDVKVSLNGSNKGISERIMVGSDFQRQIDGIQNLVKVRDALETKGKNTTVTIQVTFMEENLEDLPDLIELAKELGVDRVKGHHLWVTHPSLREQDLKRNEDSISRWNRSIKDLMAQKEHLLYSGHPLNLQNFDPISEDCGTRRTVCPFLGRELWVAWDGRVNICCAPDHQRAKFGDFGYIQDAWEMWNSHTYRKFVDSSGEPSVCGRCNMRTKEV